MNRALALAASLLCLSASSATAQDAPTVAIMAVGGTIGLEARAWIDASEAIEARLREAGYRIDDSGLPRRDDCTSLECLRQERASRDVDVLVTLTIFAAEGGDGAAGSVVVAMIDADGRYVGDEDVDGRMIGVVAALALASARSDRERGPDPWVRVAGNPTGAIVRIDGREVGVVPYEGRIAAGEHTLEVSLGGYETLTRRFTARSGSTEAIDVALTGSGPAASHGDVRTPLLITGITLTALGAVAMVVGGVIDGMEGQCTTMDGPRCAAGASQVDSDDWLYGFGIGGLGVGLPLLVISLAIDE